MALHISRSVTWFTAASVMESIGDTIARTLLPIVAVSGLGAGPGLVGALNSLGLLAFLSLSLPLGLLADRWNRPGRMMKASSAFRAVTVLAIVVVWWGGALHGTTGGCLLIVMALIIGVADVAYTTGQGLLVPRLVGPDHIRIVYGRVQSSAQAGGVLGSAALSTLLAIVAAPFAWVAAGIAYLCSVLFQRGIRGLEQVESLPSRESIWSQARHGMGHLLRNPQLRRITLANTLHNAATMAANTLLPVIALTELGVPPAGYASVGFVGAAAGIVGALGAATVTAKLGLRQTRVLAAMGAVCGVAMIMASGVVVDVLPGPPLLWLAINSALQSICTTAALVAGSDLVPAAAPGPMLGSVMGAQRTLVMGIMPVSALAIGALASGLGIRTALGIWLGLLVLSVIPSALLRNR